jgi:probable DNA metabolism protein
MTDNEKAARVWKGLEKNLSANGLKMITLSWLSEERALNQPLFNFICKVFRPQESRCLDSLENNASDPDVLAVRNTCRRVLHEQLRMKQFIRFQKAKDGTYLGVVSPDHNVLPLIIDHFQDRFNDQPWLIYDAKRHYGYYYDGTAAPIRITFEDETAVPFDLTSGKLESEVLSADDELFQQLWRTYFKAICIRERLNPKKQLSDMPRRYWKYMTEKNSK